MMETPSTSRGGEGGGGGGGGGGGVLLIRGTRWEASECFDTPVNIYEHFVSHTGVTEHEV